jgi:hypothetical protein
MVWIKTTQKTELQVTYNSLMMYLILTYPAILMGFFHSDAPFDFWGDIRLTIALNQRIKSICLMC